MELITLGSIIKAHGIKGEVKVFFNEEIFQSLKSFNHIFIQYKEGPLPYFVENVKKANDNSYLVLFEEITDRNKAELLIGKEILTDRKNIKKQKLSTGFSYCIGYKMIDQQKGEIGIVDNVFEMPANDVAQIIINNTEVLIPLNEEVIQKSDKKNKILHVQLPDGLLDVYLVTSKNK